MPAFLIPLLGDFAASFAKELVVGVIISIIFKIALFIGFIILLFKVANIEVSA